MKRTVLMLMSLLFCLCFLSVTVYAEETSPTQEQIQEQLQDSGAEDLQSYLPEETVDQLSKIGISGVDLSSLSEVSAGTIFSTIAQMISEKIPAILTAFCATLAVLILTAFLNSMKLSLGEQPVGGVIHLVGMLCVVGIVLPPIITCIAEGAAIISGGAYFHNRIYIKLNKVGIIPGEDQSSLFRGLTRKKVWMTF